MHSKLILALILIWCKCTNHICVYIYVYIYIYIYIYKLLAYTSTRIYSWYLIMKRYIFWLYSHINIHSDILTIWTTIRHLILESNLLNLHDMDILNELECSWRNCCIPRLSRYRSEIQIWNYRPWVDDWMFTFVIHENT